MSLTSARACFGVYTGTESIDRLAVALRKVQRIFDGGSRRGYRVHGRFRYASALMDDLYRDEILEHYRNPHNFGTLPDADVTYEGLRTPSAGPHHRGALRLADGDGRLEDVAFTGRGCAISQASASMLTDEIKGKSVGDVVAITNQDVLDNLGIEISPARLKCALPVCRSKHCARRSPSGPPATPLGQERVSARDARNTGFVGVRVLSRAARAAGARAEQTVPVAGRPPRGWLPPTSSRPSRRVTLPGRQSHPMEHPPPMTKTFAELMREARASVREVSTGEAELASERGARLVDVRESSEWDEGYIPGSALIAKSYLEQQIEGQVVDRNAPVILYCASGVRSLFAAQTLQQMGYTDVASMSGGFQAWKSEGREWRKPVALTPAQKQRYSRHLLMPEVGAEGQAKLLDSKVLLIGAGGLGAPAMLYLAAAGVGTIGIVDFDIVDMSNLQRQVIHTNDRVGQKKVDSAAQSINALNPETKVVTTRRCSPTRTSSGSSPATT